MRRCSLEGLVALEGLAPLGRGQVLSHAAPQQPLGLISKNSAVASWVPTVHKGIVAECKEEELSILLKSLLAWSFGIGVLTISIFGDGGGTSKMRCLDGFWSHY